MRKLQFLNPLIDLRSAAVPSFIIVIKIERGFVRFDLMQMMKN